MHFFFVFFCYNQSFHNTICVTEGLIIFFGVSNRRVWPTQGGDTLISSVFWFSSSVKVVKLEKSTLILADPTCCKFTSAMWITKDRNCDVIKYYNKLIGICHVWVLSQHATTLMTLMSAWQKKRQKYKHIVYTLCYLMAKYSSGSHGHVTWGDGGWGGGGWIRTGDERCVWVCVCLSVYHIMSCPP